MTLGAPAMTVADELVNGSTVEPLPQQQIHSNTAVVYVYGTWYVGSLPCSAEYLLPVLAGSMQNAVSSDGFQLLEQRRSSEPATSYSHFT